MATRSTRLRSRKRKFTAPRRRSTRTPRRTARAKPQEIRIVIENPTTPQAPLGNLPSQVGQVVATTPRRSRF